LKITLRQALPEFTLRKKTALYSPLSGLRNQFR